MNLRPLILLCLVGSTFLEVSAKNKSGKADAGLEGAALQYDRRARRWDEMADKTADAEKKQAYAELADKYRELRDHKIAARKEHRRGNGYDWSDYEKTRREIARLRKDHPAFAKDGPKTGKPPETAGKSKRKDKVADKGPSAKKEAAKPSKYKTPSGFEIKTDLD